MTKEALTASDIQGNIDRVMRSLVSALDAVLTGLPGGPHRPHELAKLLNLNKTLSSRVGRAVRTPDPLAAAHLMPGPEGLRILLRTAKKKGACQKSIVAAEGAVKAFDHLIRHQLGDRAAFDAIISDILPDVRHKFEMSNKQAMFKAASNLKGLTSDVCVRTFLVHPGKDPERFDYAMIVGLLGLRRLRPNAVVQCSNNHRTGSDRHDTRLTLDEHSIETIEGLLLKRFCSVPLSNIRVHHVGDSLRYIIGGEEMGSKSTMDIVIGEVNRAFFRKYWDAEIGRMSAVSAEVEQPVKTLVFDMLLHEEVWPGCEPELRVYDMASGGWADPNDQWRDVDQLDIEESIRPMGDGLERFRAREVPDYLEMLNLVFDKLGWDGSKFRGYRCHIQYPFYGSQVCMVLKPPPRPEQPEP